MSQTTRPPAWLLLVHQLPARPTSLRVKTWRRLQDVGAVALKNSVYVLPNSAQSREDFEWIKAEVQGMRGEAAVFAAQTIDAFTHDDVVAAFRRARASDYTALASEADAIVAAARKTTGVMAPKERARRVGQLRQRLASLDAIAFYPPDNRDATAASVARAAQLVGGSGPRTVGSTGTLDVADFRKRLWVTRHRPGIDRLASAWLIRRFVDPKARFGFVDAPPAGSKVVPFDMFGVEFSHTAQGCTFETLVARFRVASPAVERIAQIVHDLDLKETRYNAPEAPAMARLVDGLNSLYADDQALLTQGLVLFEALFRSFASLDQARASAGRARRPKRTGRG